MSEPSIISKLIGFKKHGLTHHYHHPEKWKWWQWLLFCLFILIIIIPGIYYIITSLGTQLSAFKWNIMIFIISIILFIILILILQILLKKTPKTKVKFINNIIKTFKFIVTFMIFGFIFSIILGPKGQKLKNAAVYLLDCLIIFFILFIILLLYNLIILYIIE